MARTSEPEVRDIYSAHDDGTAAGTDAVSFWIDAANDIVTARLSTSGLSADELQRIEALLACHGLAATDPTESEFGESDVSAVFEGAGAEGRGLWETRFGRRALMVDTSGDLEGSGSAPASWGSHGVSHDT